MNKNSINEEISNDDYLYARDLINYYVDGKLSFHELLEVLPTSLNIAKMIKIAQQGFHDKNISVEFAKMLIAHYYDRLNQSRYLTKEEDFKKVLSVKEIFFLTDSDELEKLIEGKTINLAEELRSALRLVRPAIDPILKKKVLGNSRSKMVVMITPYNSLFKKNKYLSYTPGFISPTGEITYVTDKMIEDAENFFSSNDLFPARELVEKLIRVSYYKKSETLDLEK